MSVFLEILQLAGIWTLGYITCSVRYKEKAKKILRRDAKYKIVTNAIYGKKAANVKVPRHLNGTICLDPATCKEHDAISEYPPGFGNSYFG